MTTKRTDVRRTNRLLAFIVSLALSTLAVFGAYASARGLDLGLAKAQPAAAPSLAARERKLDAYADSLRRSMARKPPPLPRVPHFPAVAISTIPAMPSTAKTQMTTADEGTVSLEAEKPAARRRVKVKYVEPPPVVQVVQETVGAQPTTAPRDDDGAEPEERGDDPSGGAPPGTLDP